MFQYAPEYRLAVDATLLLSVEQSSDLCGRLQGMRLAQAGPGQTVKDFVTTLTHGLTQSQEQGTDQHLSVASQTPAQLAHQIG
jgi:hypothetical protein